MVNAELLGEMIPVGYPLILSKDLSGIGARPKFMAQPCPAGKAPQAFPTIRLPGVASLAPRGVCMGST